MGGPKSRVLAKKSDFCHTTPILVNDPFVALGVTVRVFVKKIRLTRQKAFPLPTVGASSASNSPSALSVQALRLEKPLKKAFAFLYSIVISQTSIRAMWWWELKNFYARDVVVQAEKAI